MNLTVMTQEERTEYKALIDNVKKIRFILESDNRTNSKGLVENVNENKVRLTKLEDTTKQINTKLASYGAIGGFIAGILVWLAKTLLSKDL